MGRIVHARLDDRTARAAARLRRETGWRDSEIIRRGILSLAAVGAPHTRPRFVGVGKFASGIPDLGSNKQHIEGFGR
jgi:hypothetical protein